MSGNNLTVFLSCGQLALLWSLRLTWVIRISRILNGGWTGFKNCSAFNFFTFVLYFWPYHAAYGVSVPWPGWNLRPLHWKHGVNLWTTREVLQSPPSLKWITLRHVLLWISDFLSILNSNCLQRELVLSHHFYGSFPSPFLHQCFLDHLSNKLLALESLSQGLFTAEPS